MTVPSVKHFKFDWHLLRPVADFFPLRQTETSTRTCRSGDEDSYLIEVSTSITKIFEKQDLLSFSFAQQNSIYNFANLPKSLTSLDVSSTVGTYAHPLLRTDFEPWKHISRLVNLKSLDVSRVENIQNDWIQYLPRGLTTLKMNFARGITQTCDFPRTLTYLSLELASLSDDAIPDLPQGLTYLNLRNSCYLTDDSIAKLPRSLTYYKNNAPTYTDRCIRHLPSRLRGLDLGEAQKVTTEALKDLPRELICLVLSGIHTTQIKDLPSGMLHLVLMGRDLVVNDLMSLPTNLTYLGLPHAGITDIKNLPAKLLELNISRSQISEFELECLPDHLNHLDLSLNEVITGEVLSILPKSLKFLILPHNLQPTEAQRRHLPNTTILQFPTLGAI